MSIADNSVKLRILEAMAQSDRVNVMHIDLDFQDGTVVLQGTVFSEEEWEAAEWACWIEGVERVENLLVIPPPNFPT